MAYSDFTLKRVKSDLNIKIIENEELFPNIGGIEISQFLETMLKRNIPLALAINTEKARSELIIANILLEVKDQLKNEVSFFSGIEFTLTFKHQKHQIMGWLCLRGKLPGVIKHLSPLSKNESKYF